MLEVETEPSAIHKRPFLLPSPASTTASGSKAEVTGSASSPCSSANFPRYPVSLRLHPSFIHIDPVSGCGTFLVRFLVQRPNTVGSRPVSLFYKRKHEET